MKKLIIGVVAAALLVTGTVFVFAHRSQDRERRGDGHRGKGAMFLRGLDLTEEQKAKVKEIFDAGKVTVEGLREQSRANRDKLQALGSDGTFDQAQVEAIAAEQGNITARMIVEKERTRSQIFAILTDEQRTRAAEMKSKFGERKSRGHKGSSPAGEEL